MKQQSKLLKVVSILMIIFGALGTISTLMSTIVIKTVMQSPEIQESYAALGMPEISTGYYIFTVLVAVLELAAGIVGVMYRSKKSVLITGIIWITVVLINLIWGCILVGFQFTIIFSLTLPALYLLGWYQSN